jgi:uncharacterized protein (TIGR00730 family)
VRGLEAMCVFASSSDGLAPVYREAAAALGELLAAEGMRLVYGGGSVGLMGVLADAALAAGGEVVGVIPRGLFVRESVHPRVSDLHEVGSMHERKLRMYELSDGFIALPGGLGTLEELAEITTWAQLGLHDKPIGVRDANGFYAPFLAFLDRMVDDGFVTREIRDVVLDDTDPSRLLARMRRAQPPARARWVTSPEET